MCANYQILVRERFRDEFTPLEVTFEYKTDCYPGYDAPVLIAGAPGGDLVPVRATFGMLSHWAKGNALARQTYNARTETVAAKPSFREAWKRRQFCLIPVQQFYEPNWESGKAIRYGIRRKDAKPFALAGIWETRRVGEAVQRSFSMLTINATDHPLMKHFHRPEDEKRSVVVVPPDGYQAWLAGRDEAEIREMLKPMDPQIFEASPQPRPKREAPVAPEET